MGVDYETTLDKGLCSGLSTFCVNKGRPPIPTKGCKEEACLPLWRSETLFDGATLEELEKQYLRSKQSTRSEAQESKCKPDACPPAPPDTRCDSNGNSCCTDAGPATACVPVCESICPQKNGVYDALCTEDGDVCRPTKNTPGNTGTQNSGSPFGGKQNWWASADLLLQCRNKLWDSTSAPEVRRRASPPRRPCRLPAPTASRLSPRSPLLPVRSTR